MVDDNIVPERRGAEARTRRGAKEPRSHGSGARKRDGAGERMRVSYRVTVETWQRLGIHCRLARVDENAFVERAVLSLLRQIGKGQDVFDRAVHPDTQEDRQDTTAA